MSRSQRILLVVAALVVAVVAFVIARPGDDEPEGSAATTPAQTEPDGGGATANPQPTTETEPPPDPEPRVARVTIADGAVEGGPRTIEVTRGDLVRIVVSADAPDEIHLHGYDITQPAGPDRPARFRFAANAEGAFEIESHVAEDAGKDPLVARVVVEPE